MTTITEATVMYRETAKIGDRVKHYGMRWPEAYDGVAVITGFTADEDHLYRGKPWVMVHVEYDPGRNTTLYGTSWDWDRTELILNG
jgi:hypothetical protein